MFFPGKQQKKQKQKQLVKIYIRNPLYCSRNVICLVHCYYDLMRYFYLILQIKVPRLRDLKKRIQIHTASNRKIEFRSLSTTLLKKGVSSPDGLSPDLHRGSLMSGREKTESGLEADCEGHRLSEMRHSGCLHSMCNGKS